MRIIQFILLCFCLAAEGAWADGPQFWTIKSKNDFLSGRFDGVSILGNETLVLAPEVRLLDDTGEPFIWCMASAADGTVYAGTGHDGRVLSVTTEGDTATVYDALEPEVMSLAVDRKSDLFIGTSPEGRVYRLVKVGGEAEVFFDPEETYIWALAFGPKGYLYAATGPKGRVYRVSPSGEAVLLIDSEEQHIISLAFDREGNLLAGSSGSGLLYQVDPSGRVSILYDSSMKDIRSIVVDSRNNLYVAAFELQSPAAHAKMLVPQPEAAAEKPSDGETPKEGEPGKKPEKIVIKIPSPTRGIMANSEIYLLDKDRFVTRIWRGAGEAVMALGMTENDRALFVSSKKKNYIFSIDRLGDINLLSSFSETEVTGFCRTRGRILLCTSNQGKIFELRPQFRTSGLFTSPVLNAGLPSQWGTVAWEGKDPSGTKVSFRTRSGNTARPDTTWSPWSSPFSGKPGEVVSSPPRQYLQWEASFSSSRAGVTPELSQVSVSYLRRNRPPLVSRVRFMPQGVHIKSPANSAARHSGGRDYPYEAKKL
ncbi:MAG: hypothetical protein U9N45_07180, partial [Gemmatimonadota bacterium]|nr:hypothetical protein [Gemmatimonadota bacterium]